VPGNVGQGRRRIELDSKPVLLKADVGERLSLSGTGKAAMIVTVANRAREIRPSGMTWGASGDDGHGGTVNPPRYRKGRDRKPSAYRLSRSGSIPTCDEGIANHTGHKPCAGIREGVGEASAGVRAGQPSNRVRKWIPGTDAVYVAQGKTTECANASARAARRGRRTWHARTLLEREPGERAATLAAIPAGESPASGDCPVDTVVISGGGEGDRTVESLEVKASVREASNSAGCSESESASPEKVDVGSAEPLRSLGEGKRSSRRNWVSAATGFPGTLRATCWEGMASESAEPLAGRLGAPAQRRHRI
jgi:hypothetical protein